MNICFIIAVVVRTSRLLYHSSMCEDYVNICCSTVVSGRTVCILAVSQQYL
jgi:hypothetical protein